MNKIVAVIFLFLFLASNSFAQGNPIWIRTSNVDYETMKIVDTSATTTTVLKTKKINGKNSYITFTAAFREFHTRNLATIKDFIEKNHYDGVCNLKISFDVTDQGYYFLCTYDAYVFKNK